MNTKSTVVTRQSASETRVAALFKIRHRVPTRPNTLIPLTNVVLSYAKRNVMQRREVEQCYHHPPSEEIADIFK